MKKMKNEPESTEYKILLLGESNVGKTTIFNRYISNTVEKNVSSTIGVDFETKTLEHKGKKYIIKLFDTAGQERFQGITRSYYHMGDGFLIVFDLTNEHSLKMVQKWVDSIKEEINDCKFLILGNKSDLKDNFIPNNIIDEYLKNYKNIFIKTSALNNKNIDEAFKCLLDLLGNEEINLDDNKEPEIKKTNSFYLKNGNHEKNIKKAKNKRCC